MRAISGWFTGSITARRGTNAVQCRAKHAQPAKRKHHDFRFRAEETLEKVVVDEIQFEYLYSDGDTHHFMNTENYEQLALQNDIVGDTRDYLIPNLPVKIEYYDDKPIGVLLPDTVDLTVVETEQSIQKPGERGDEAGEAGRLV